MQGVRDLDLAGRAGKAENAVSRPLSGSRIVRAFHVESDQVTIACRGCGKAGPVQFGAFCSSACYQRERRRRLRSQVCTGCRRSFIPTRKDARFCSDACRFRAYRGRLAAKADAERVRDLAKAAADRKAAEVARKRADFIASLIG